MTIITIPDTLLVARQSWGQHRNVIGQTSVFGAQSLEPSMPAWEMSIAPPSDLDEYAGSFQALMLSLRGHTNLLACHNLRRPVPIGTMRGTMTLSAIASSGASSMSIVASGQANKTLNVGDYLGLGSGASQHVVMLVAAATANASGVITVTFEPPLRNSFAAGSSVIWDKPKALFRRTEVNSRWDYENVLVSGMSMSFIEDWRP